MSGARNTGQCFELTNQMLGTCEKRQVEGAKLALEHNVGLGGACVMAMDERG